MCGICGFTGKPENREDVIRRMTDVITHRGPDSEGFYSDDFISMGFRRLSIIDLQAGHQPIYNEDKTLVLTFNGEIYNYKALKKELVEKGHTFVTESDSEVLVHGFEEWHEDLLPRLRGMFGFAIYNTKDKSIFIARDFFGIKPMHYAMVGDDFVYASEIKSILEHPNYEKRFNKRALDTYLSFQYAVPPETFFVDILCLLPGHYLWYKDGVVETTRYFEPRFRPKQSMTEDEAVNKIEKVFENSVNAHKIADVEVGCFLSSGVDSSYVSTYFADQKTFTVGFDFGEKYNEISWAENLSKLIGVEHHTHLISSEEFWDAVPTVQYYMDQPLADPSCVALYFVSRLASNYVKVVLSGEGADELFGGYTCYNDPRVFKLYQKIVPHFLRKGLRAIAQKLPDIKGRDFVIRACDKLEERYIGNAYMYDLKQKQKLLKEPSIATAPNRITRRHYYRCRRYDDVTKMQYLDINMWMTGDILLKADRMSMANSLELRVPFLDKEVFKVAATLPTSLRVNKENTKYAMRKAAARHMPETTAEKEKLGFPVPTRVWLKDEKYYNIVKAKFKSETAEKFFNTDALVRWLDQHFKGKEDNSRRVWTIYVFLVWYDIYFNEKNPHPEKPENHLDELKAAAKAKRGRKINASEDIIKAAAESVGNKEVLIADDEEKVSEAPEKSEKTGVESSEPEVTEKPEDAVKEPEKAEKPESEAEGSEKAEKSEGEAEEAKEAEKSEDAAKESEKAEKPEDAAEEAKEAEKSEDEDKEAKEAEKSEGEAEGSEKAEKPESEAEEAKEAEKPEDAAEEPEESEKPEGAAEEPEEAAQPGDKAPDPVEEMQPLYVIQQPAEAEKSAPEARKESARKDNKLHGVLKSNVPAIEDEPVNPEDFDDLVNLFRSDSLDDDFFYDEEGYEDDIEDYDTSELYDVPEVEELADVYDVTEIEEHDDIFDSPVIEEHGDIFDSHVIEEPDDIYDVPEIEAPVKKAAAPKAKERDDIMGMSDVEAFFGDDDDEAISLDGINSVGTEAAAPEEEPADDGSEPALIENGDDVVEEVSPEEYINISNPDDKNVYAAPRKPATHQEKMQMALDSIERRAKYLDEPNVISDEAVSDIVSQISFYDEEEDK